MKLSHRYKGYVNKYHLGYPTDYQVAVDLDNTEDCTININKVHRGKLNIISDIGMYKNIIFFNYLFDTT